MQPRPAEGLRLGAGHQLVLLVLVLLLLPVALLLLVLRCHVWVPRGGVSSSEVSQALILLHDCSALVGWHVAQLVHRAAAVQQRLRWRRRRRWWWRRCVRHVAAAREEP
jgi:hypothetical protein